MYLGFLPSNVGGYLTWTSISNGTGQWNFSGQRDRSSIIVLGQQDKQKLLPRDGTGWTVKIQDGAGWDRAEKDILKQEKDVLKQENDVLKQEIWSFFWKFLIHFVLGRPETEEFAPGFLLLPLSRDKGTTGRPVSWKH